MDGPASMAHRRRSEWRLLTGMRVTFLVAFCRHNHLDVGMNPMVNLAYEIRYWSCSDVLAAGSIFKLPGRRDFHMLGKRDGNCIRQL
jgi:hypothetical protein